MFRYNLAPSSASIRPIGNVVFGVLALYTALFLFGKKNGYSSYFAMAGTETTITDHEKGPYYQHLPNCNSKKALNNRISKKTTAKAIVCPMIRDEEGFLSEWVAYYQMHGFDHVMVFNDKSVDGGLQELQPWIDSGVVSVRSNWTADSLNVSWAFRRNDFKRAMTMKALLESNCKAAAVSWGYDFYVSLDIDEYLIPRAKGVTIVDALVNWANSTQRSVYCVAKNNFASTPHLLEPVNLLTIEAYQTRMPITTKMNYYMSVSPKCAYQLRGPQFHANTTHYIVECCHFHGCQGWDFRAGSDICTYNHKEQSWFLAGKGKKWYDAFIINHYSRSVEKYSIKSKTWQTATGEAKAGESAEQAAKSYDIPKFLSRNVGWQYDPIALRYSCQLRAQLQNMTNEEKYLRPGTGWYRNPEFGRPITDPDKRGRYGRPNPEGFIYTAAKNPYHYHGGEEQSPSSGKKIK